VKKEAVEDSRVAYLINEVLALHQHHHCKSDKETVKQLKEEYKLLVEA